MIGKKELDNKRKYEESRNQDKPYYNEKKKR